jgi:hypothetical protein
MNRTKKMVDLKKWMVHSLSESFSVVGGRQDSSGFLQFTSRQSPGVQPLAPFQGECRSQAPGSLSCGCWGLIRWRVPMRNSPKAVPDGS